MEGKNYFNGHGDVWINDEEYAEVYSANATKTINYEEIPDPHGNGQLQVFMGYAIAGTLTMRKRGNEKIIRQLIEDETGYLDVELVIKAENKNTGIVERVKYIDVTFDSVQTSNFENQSITEIELPFKARKLEVLD